MKVSNFLLIITVVAVVPGALTAREPLDSISQGNFDAALEYVKNAPQDLNESVNDTLENGRGALHILAQGEAGAETSIVLIRELVDGGADINTRDESDYNRTPLHVAIAHEQTEIALEFCRLGADVNLKTDCGASALYYAAQYDNSVVAKKILEADDIDIDSSAKLGWTPLHKAAEKGHDLVLQLLVNAGADCLLCTDEEDQGVCALHIAASMDNISAARILLDARTPVDILDSKRRTPLHRACAGGFVDIVELLCDSGADIDKIDGKCNGSPYYYAWANKDKELCRVLQARGAHLIGDIGEHNHWLCILSSASERVLGHRI